MDFPVDRGGRFFAEFAHLGKIASKKNLVIAAEGDGAQIAHAPLAYHFVSQVRTALEVVGCAAGKLVVYNFFRRPACHHDSYHGQTMRAGYAVTVLFRK